MKTKAIEMGVVLFGPAGEKLAADEWEKMKAKLFLGAEPTDEALKHFGPDDLAAAGISPGFARPWGKLFQSKAAG